MAQSTPIRGLGDVSSVTFHFPLAASANVALFFYDSLGDPLIPSAGGSRDLALEILYPSYSGAASDPSPFGVESWEPTNAVTTLAGGTMLPVSFGASAGSLTITPSAPVDPGAAVGYAIKIDRPQARPAT